MVDTTPADAPFEQFGERSSDEWSTDVEDLRPRGESPRGWGPIESIGRRPKAFVVPLLVCGLLGLVIGIVRAPVFSSEAQLVVGGTVRAFEPAEGQSAALQDLTDIYSRLVGSSRHVQLASAALGADVPPESVSAAPIPDSVLIRLDATGSTQDEADARADAAANALVELVEALKTEAAAANAETLTALQARQSELYSASLARDAAQAAYTASATPANREALVAAEGLVNRLDLQVTVARDAYTSSESARGGGVDLEVFAAAEPFGSDRRDQLLIYVMGGLVLGALIGMALATLAANRWQVVPVADRPTDVG